MNEVNKVIEIAKQEREKLAERIINLNPEYAKLNDDEREAKKQVLLGVIEDTQSKYRLVKSGKVSEEQLFDYLELLGEKGSSSYELSKEILKLADEEDENLSLVDQIKAVEEDISRSKEKIYESTKYIAKALLSQKKYEFKPEYCDVLLSWFLAVESKDEQKVYEASHVLLPVLSKLISEQYSFNVKRGRGKRILKPKHMKMYAYSDKHGDNVAADKFSVSVEAIRQARFKVKNKYKENELEIEKCFALYNIYMDDLKSNSESMTNQQINVLLNELKLLEEQINTFIS